MMNTHEYVIGYFDKASAEAGDFFFLFLKEVFDVLSHISFYQSLDYVGKCSFPLYYRFNFEQIQDYAYFNRLSLEVHPSWECYNGIALPDREANICDLFTLNYGPVVFNMKDSGKLNHIVSTFANGFENVHKEKHFIVGLTTGKVTEKVEEFNLSLPYSGL